MKHLFFALIFFPLITLGQLKLAKVFSDNMVLQRGEPIHIRGKAAPGKKVEVSFAGEWKSTTVSDDSSWSVYLNKQKANLHAQSLVVSSGNDKVELRNILVGDVWIASGQSNMEWPMSREMHWKEEAKNTSQPLIRLNNPPPAGRNVYGVAYTDSLNRRLTSDHFYLWNGWKSCDSQTVRDMSAVAYYFAKSIVEKEGIPVGIINLSIGGAPIETFISRDAFMRSKKFASKLEGKWLENDHLPEWIRQRGKENVGNHTNAFRDELGSNHAYKPGFAFESGIKALSNFPVKGIIWYQGESNSLEEERVWEYRELMHLMISDYRQRWKNPDMPFYWVQLSSIDTAHYKSHYWPLFRDEQRRFLDDIKQGGMAVSSDAGLKNDVHPRNKKLIGERLARWALTKEYGHRMLPSGPLPRKAAFRKDKVVISFHHTGSGISTADGKALRGFSLDGKSEVEAVIKNKTVVIAVKKKPDAIFYGWKPYTDANLVNADSLPASTFKLKVE